MELFLNNFHILRKESNSHSMLLTLTHLQKNRSWCIWWESKQVLLVRPCMKRYTTYSKTSINFKSELFLLLFWWGIQQLGARFIKIFWNSLKKCFVIYICRKNIKQILSILNQLRRQKKSRHNWWSKRKRLFQLTILTLRPLSMLWKLSRLLWKHYWSFSRKIKSRLIWRSKIVRNKKEIGKITKLWRQSKTSAIFSKHS